MKKAFLIAGVALTLSLVLIMALNYVVYSDRLMESSVQQRMLIDHVDNRATDVYRIVHDSALDAKNESLAPAAIQSRVDSSLAAAKAYMAQEGLTFTYSFSAVDATHIAGNYTIDASGFHKVVSFSQSY